VAEKAAPPNLPPVQPSLRLGDLESVRALRRSARCWRAGTVSGTRSFLKCRAWQYRGGQGTAASPPRLRAPGVGVNHLGHLLLAPSLLSHAGGPGRSPALVVTARKCK